MMREPSALTISTGISKPVVAAMRDYAYGANLLGAASAAVTFPAGLQGMTAPRSRPSARRRSAATSRASPCTSATSSTPRSAAVVPGVRRRHQRVHRRGELALRLDDERSRRAGSRGRAGALFPWASPTSSCPPTKRPHATWPCCRAAASRCKSASTRPRSTPIFHRARHRARVAMERGEARRDHASDLLCGRGCRRARREGRRGREGRRTPRADEAHARGDRGGADGAARRGPHRADGGGDRRACGRGGAVDRLQLPRDARGGYSWRSPSITWRSGSRVTRSSTRARRSDERLARFASRSARSVPREASRAMRGAAAVVLARSPAVARTLERVAKERRAETARTFGREIAACQNVQGSRSDRAHARARDVGACVGRDAERARSRREGGEGAAGEDDPHRGESRLTRM